MPNKSPEAAYRTCPACGGTRFHLVGFENRTYLVCDRGYSGTFAIGTCPARPFPSSQKGHLGRATMPPQDIADFKQRLAAGEQA